MVQIMIMVDDDRELVLYKNKVKREKLKEKVKIQGVGLIDVHETKEGDTEVSVCWFKVFL